MGSATSDRRSFAKYRVEVALGICLPLLVHSTKESQDDIDPFVAAGWSVSQRLQLTSSSSLNIARCP
jgi:hypothetical protein